MPFVWNERSHIFGFQTQRQQRSGLGIEAQRAAIERFAAAEQLTIAAEFVEAESGKGQPTPWTDGPSWPQRSPAQRPVGAA